MNSRKCSTCGRIYPLNWNGKTCRFCHTPLPGGICPGCGEYVDRLQSGHCTKCRSRLHAAWRARKRGDSATRYKNWLNKIASLPKPYKTLTEDQWNKACRHFSGCAYCGEPEIVSRSMFIPFKNGGRYCSWNIIPACEKCETSIVREENPFLRMNTQINRSAGGSARKLGLSEVTLQKIVDYLEGEMK